MSVGKYRKRPVVIEAMQHVGGDVSRAEISGWIVSHSGNVLSILPTGSLQNGQVYNLGFHARSLISGQQLRRLQGHKDGVFAVVFSADGKSVFSGSNDETIRML